jgi:hypothetical protein
VSSSRPEAEGSGDNKLGLTSGQVVQELGWDEDADEDVRIMVEDAIDSELFEEVMEAAEVVLMWWRDSDGDLADGLVDALTDLAEDGYIWLLTPKVGREGFVDPTDVAEAAVSAGLSVTIGVSVSSEWAANKLVRPKNARR